MTGTLSVFISTANRAEADKIGLALVEEKLAACVNILPDVHSIYRWQGKIEQSDECALIAKTTVEKFEVLQARVKQLHSYECPCVVAWPIVAGNPDYLDWVIKGV